MQLPIIYLHIPKTAGTSFRKSAEQYFGPEQVLNDYGEDSSTTSEDIRSAIYDEKNIEKLRQAGAKYRFLTGHFTLAKYREIFPDSPVVTFFRDPVQRVISEYVHFVTHYNFEGSLRDFYTRPQLQNRQWFSMSYSSPDEIDFFGLTEDYQKSLKMINRRFGTNFPMVKLNVGRHNGLTQDIASQEELEEIASLNHHDVDLYQLALQAFENQSTDQKYSFKTIKQFCGSMGKIKQGKLVGWLVDREAEEPACLTVSINGQARKKLIADLYREDVQRKGLHVNGKCGFQLTLDDLGRVGPGDRISISTADGKFEFSNSPVVVPG